MRDVWFSAKHVWPRWLSLITLGPSVWEGLLSILEVCLVHPGGPERLPDLSVLTAWETRLVCLRDSLGSVREFLLVGAWSAPRLPGRSVAAVAAVAAVAVVALGAVNVTGPEASVTSALQHPCSGAGARREAQFPSRVQVTAP